MRHSARICVVGSANVDLTFRAPRFPREGETLTGRSLHQGMGGKGANQAVAAARLGAEVTFVARVGDDAFGAEAIRRYQSERIDTRFVRQDVDQPTGTAAIVVDDQAENRIIVVPGANARLTPQDVRDASSEIERADLVLCQLETPLEATLEAFWLARAAGRRTILTPAPVQELPGELLGLCDVCVLNRTEIEFLVGHAVKSHDEAGAAARSLIARGVRSVALTLGGEGAHVADATQESHVPAVKVDAVDTTGAGDAFTAALAVAIAEGSTLTVAASQASRVAAITVTRIGTQAAFPYRHEISDDFGS